jgi:probable phosphoglycerate mutase
LTTTIWLVRHGETDWNAERRLQGSTDIVLNDVGHAQAACVAARLRPVELHAIYASPLQRTMQTASPLLATRAHMSLLLMPEIAERDFGQFQGLTPEEVARAHPEAFERWQSRDPKFCPPGGESLLDFQHRVKHGLHTLVAQHLGQTIAVFSHGGVLDMIYRIAKQIEIQAPRQWPIPNAGIQRLVGGPHMIDVVDWGVTDHLIDPASRDELRGIS